MLKNDGEGSTRTRLGERVASPAVRYQQDVHKTGPLQEALVDNVCLIASSQRNAALAAAIEALHPRFAPPASRRRRLMGTLWT